MALVEHVVFFTSPDGASLFRRTPDLEAAVRFVEQLRNADGVEDTQVYALTHVPLAFRSYIKVEVPRLDQPVPLPEPLPAEPEAVTEPQAVNEPELVAEPEPAPAPEPAPEPVAEPILAEVVAELPTADLPADIAEPEPVAELAAEAAPEPVAVLTEEPLLEEEFQPAPGVDVLPSEDFVTAEPGGGRNGKARGMGFFSR